MKTRSLTTPVTRWHAGRSTHLRFAFALSGALAGLLPGLPTPRAQAQESPTYYVNVANANPAFPFTSWATAATNLQDAVNAGTAAGRLVLVTNGVYQTGTVEANGGNRVALTNLVLRSVNGPDVTIIDGGRRLRGVYLGTNAVLSGFTVRNGRAWAEIMIWEELRNGAGVLSEASGVVTNCVLTGNSSEGRVCDPREPTPCSTTVGGGGGAYGGTLYNCVLTGNSGSGASGSTLYNCVLTGNSGGGAHGGRLYNCTLTGNAGNGANWATLDNCTLTGNAGAGAAWGTLYNCTLTGNAGEGAFWATLHNCTLTGNAGAGAFWGTLYSCALTGNAGAGAVGGTLYNCALTGNSGGGASRGTLYNCTLTGNSNSGAQNATLYNCIVYFNQGGNWAGSTFEYSCTTPLPPGPGNITADPQLASATHLSSTSPCLGAGGLAWATGVDLDGEPWADPPAMGADQLRPERAVGPLTMQITSEFTEVVPGQPLSFTAHNAGPILESVWNFGDGTAVTNQAYISHAWQAPGSYTVRLTGYNDSHPEGVAAELQVEVIEAVHYVDVANPTPAFPFTSWATAATAIQDAVNAGRAPGRLVLVTNGVYQAGTVEANGMNRVAMTNVVLRSVNGPEATIIDGAGAVRCVYLGGNTTLSGFTVRNGSGGVVAVAALATGVVTNCVLTGNSGAGAHGGTLYNCVLTGNSGGGALGGTLYNCVLTGNSGGGASGGTLYNCIVYFNQGGNWAGSTFEDSCTTPLPPGPGNIAADPQLASATHLSSTSPCLGTGNPAWATGLDIDGDPWADPPAMGADQLWPGQTVGPLTTRIHAPLSEVAVGLPLSFAVQHTGRITESVWDFGDGTVLTNRPFISHAWTAPGTYALRLTGYNDTHPEGVATTLQVEVLKAVIHYVRQANLTPAFPYTRWTTAATNIQDAVNACARTGGRTVLVANGVYQAGTVEANGANRVALTNVVLRSVNGPEVTIIDGAGAVRCVSLGTNATLSGFTVRNGYGSGGGVAALATGVVTNCVLTGNSAGPGSGGGASGGTLYSCTLTGNSDSGAYESTLYNCTLTGNSGNGASGSTLYNCTLTGNSGSGAHGGTLYNCTLTGNSYIGAYNATLYNCIVYFNQSGNWTGGTFEYSCTTPLPPGPGNISADPQLASATRLSSTSPCLGAGNPAWAKGLDLDGEPWADPPAMGADQVWPGQSSGTLSVRIQAQWTQVVPSLPISFGAEITGFVTRSVWDFADGSVVPNQPFLSHTWTAEGTYTVRLTAYNDSHPEGVTTDLPIQVIQAVHYVNAANPKPVFPYTSWATAATNIQDAVNAGTVPRRTVLVTNGVYQTGVTWVAGSTNLSMVGGSANRVALTNVVLRSVNGPEVTIVDGAGVVSCVYLGANAVLDGFTVRNGCAWPDEAAIARWESEFGGGFVFGCGGGVYSAASGVVTNCVLSNNKALSVSSIITDCCPPTLERVGGEGTGGGAYGGTLYNCVLAGNRADGAAFSTLFHCTLIGNGAGDPTLGGPHSTFYNCILEPDTIEADRGFVNAAAGDFRLRYGSPYIDAGAALDIPITHDLDGLPRPLDGNGDGRAVPDMGAYEFDLRTVVPAQWFTQHNLDASDPFVLSGNPDADGQTSFQEWLAGTDPRDPLSFFRIEAVEAGPPARLFYRSLDGRVYSLYAASELAGGSGGTTPWAPVLGQLKLPASGGLDSLTDTNAPPQRFYRVGVELP